MINEMCTYGRISFEIVISSFMDVGRGLLASPTAAVGAAAADASLDSLSLQSQFSADYGRD